IEDYNEMVEEMLENDPDCERILLPQIVIVVDEFADLMLAAKNEVEESVMRLAQLARAAGMHMLIATQSPRVDVLTGLIKANIPSRTALMVSNNTDSRVILDEVGAEKLLGKGDMLYKPVGFPKPMRIQSGFASTAEIRGIVDFLKNEHGSGYDQEVVHEVEQNMPKPKDDDGADITINPDDDLVNQAITIIVETGNASTAFLQRKLKLGFPRAARIMDDIEAMGIIGPQEGAKPRKILLTKEEWYERQGKE
ncbi:MAG: DNA translocase FtsK, partial [Ruminococcus sp.]|nr:DNA translocase FtsK [Ruminococcus sp.]